MLTINLPNSLIRDPDVFKRSHIAAGFEKCGLFPVNRQAVSSDHLRFASSDDSDSDSESDSDSDSDSGSSSDSSGSESNSGLLQVFPPTQLIPLSAQSPASSSPSPNSPAQMFSPAVPESVVVSKIVITQRSRSITRQLSQHSFRHSRSNSPSDMNRSLIRSRSSSRESYHSPVLPNYKRKPVKSPIIVNSAHINQLVRNELRDRSKESSKKSKKRRVSQKGGSCLTSTEVIQQFEEEAAEKEREINEKLDAKAKKEETKLKKQELTQVRKINKSRKQCHLCQSMQNTDKDKARWVTCFNCSRW